MDSSFFFNAILRRSPMLVMAFGGIVIALVRWKRHTKVSLLTLFGLGLYFFQAVVFTIVFYFVATLLDQLRWADSSSRWFHTVLYLVQDFFISIMLILLVAAALSQRKTSPLNTN